MVDSPWDRLAFDGSAPAGDNQATTGEGPPQGSPIQASASPQRRPWEGVSYCRANNSAMTSGELSDGGSIAGDWTTSIVHLLAGPAPAQSPDLTRVTRQPASPSTDGPSRFTVGGRDTTNQQPPTPEPLGWPESSNRGAANSSSYSSRPFPIPYCAAAPDDPEFSDPSPDLISQPSQETGSAGHRGPRPGAGAPKPWEATGLLYATANHAAWSWSTATDLNMSTRSALPPPSQPGPQLITPAPADAPHTAAAGSRYSSEEPLRREGHIQDISPLDAAGYAVPRPQAGPAAAPTSSQAVAYDSPLDFESDNNNDKLDGQPQMAQPIPAGGSPGHRAERHMAPSEAMRATEARSDRTGGQRSDSPLLAPASSAFEPPDHIHVGSSPGHVSSYLETSGRALNRLRDSLKSWGDVVGLHAPPETQAASRVSIVGSSTPTSRQHLRAQSPATQRSPAAASAGARALSIRPSPDGSAGQWVDESKSSKPTHRSARSREWASELAREIVQGISTCPSSRNSGESLHFDVMAPLSTPAPRKKLYYPMSAPRPSRGTSAAPGDVDHTAPAGSSLDMLIDVIKGRSSQTPGPPEERKGKKIARKKKRRAASASPSQDRRYHMRCSPHKDFTRWVLAKDVTAYKAVAAAVTPAGDTIYISVFDGRTLYTLGEEMLNTNLGWFVYMKPEEALKSYIPSRCRAVVDRFPRLILKVLVCGRGYQQGPSYSFPVLGPVDVIYPEEIQAPAPAVCTDNVPDLNAMLDNVDEHSVLQAFRSLVV